MIQVRKLKTTPILPRAQKKLGLNERQVKAILYVKKNGKITNREYRELNNISDEGAMIDLNILIERDILIQQGKGRAVQYVPVED